MKVLYKNKYVLDLEDTLSLHIPPTLACVSWPASSARPRCVMGRSRRSWVSCKMNKCCFEPSSLKKAVLFVQRWCGQQTLSLKNASFHVLLSFQLKCSSNIDSIHYLGLTNSFDRVPRNIHTLPSIIVNFLLNSLNAPITFVVCATNKS